MKSVTKPMKHRCASRNNDTIVEGLSKINIALLDGRYDHFMNSRVLKTDTLGGEEDLRCKNLLFVEHDLRTVWQEVDSLVVGRGATSSPASYGPQILLWDIEKIIGA